MTMGLDVYFYKNQKSNTLSGAGKTLLELRRELHGVLTAEQDKQLKSVCETLNEYEKNNHLYDEIAYFRKAYFILSYFNYTDNCSDMIIDREELEFFLSLLRDWAIIAIDKSKYEEDEYDDIIRAKFGLNDLDEFIFDDSPYEIDNETICHYISTIEDVLNNTDKETEDIILHCWW